MLAGDLAAAELELRRGVELLEGMGERAYLSTLGAMLADVLSRRHRLPGPLAGSQGQAPSQAGAVEPAEALGREAVRLAAPTTSSTCTATVTWRSAPCRRPRLFMCTEIRLALPSRRSLYSRHRWGHPWSAECDHGRCQWLAHRFADGDRTLQ
jgi:hypothetical protein